MNIFWNELTVAYLQALIFGAIIGSFLNVVIYRLPRMLQQRWQEECMELLKTSSPIQERIFNLSYPSSHCPHCQHPIRPWENIPILSYILLQGRCSACNTPISLRYPFTEICSALLTLIVIIHFGITWQAVTALFLTWGLLALSLIDYDTQLLPDNLTLPLLWLGLLISLANIFVSPQEAIMGAAAGYLILWSVFHLFLLVTGKEGMGYGDFKLLAMLGAWQGLQSLPQIILLSSCTGAIVGIFLIIVRGHQLNQPIPFGPYLALAGWINLLWGPQINLLYTRML